MTPDSLSCPWPCLSLGIALDPEEGYRTGVTRPLGYTSAPMTADDERRPRRRGPRGGTTTVSRDGAMLRKTYYLDWDIVEALQREARRRGFNEAQYLRHHLRDHFHIE